MTTTLRIAVGDELKLEVVDLQEMVLGFGYKEVPRITTGTVKQIKESEYGPFITIETDGFMPHVFTARQLREAMKKAEPEKFEYMVEDIYI